MVGEFQKTTADVYLEVGDYLWKKSPFASDGRNRQKLSSFSLVLNELRVVTLPLYPVTVPAVCLEQSAHFRGQSGVRLRR